MIKCPFGKNYFCQLILLFSLFLLLFMNLTAFFGTIHGSHYIILANFYFYLQYFQQKVFIFNKISGPQTDLKDENDKKMKSKISLDENLERFNKKKSKEITVNYLQHEITIIKKEII